jgi:hypothetical protein
MTKHQTKSDIRMPRKQILTMVQYFGGPGAWHPRSDADRRLLLRLVKSTSGPVLSPGEADSAHRFAALCLDQNIRVILDPAQSDKQPPSPAPARGRGGRQK